MARCATISAALCQRPVTEQRMAQWTKARQMVVLTALIPAHLLALAPATATHLQCCGVVVSGRVIIGLGSIIMSGSCCNLCGPTD